MISYREINDFTSLSDKELRRMIRYYRSDGFATTREVSRFTQCGLSCPYKANSKLSLATLELEKRHPPKTVPFTHEDYKNYMLSSEWKKRRSDVIKRDRSTCLRCGMRDSKATVHHLTYISFGNENPRELATVCLPCHKAIHQK